MLKACVICGTPSQQARCPDHRTHRPRGHKARKLRQAIIQRDGYRCQRCGRYLDGTRDTHVDHVQPLALGGTTTPSNLQTLCATCNMRKGTTHQAR